MKFRPSPYQSRNSIRRRLKLYRLKRRGLLPTLTKTEARILCAQAVIEFSNRKKF